MFLAFFAKRNLWCVYGVCVLLLLSGCGDQASSSQLPQKTPVPAGEVSEFPIDGSVGSLAVGSDGNLWFTETLPNKIGRMTPKGAVTTFTIPTPSSDPDVITSGPGGDLWFTEAQGKIGRITPSGTISEFAIPTPYHSPAGITAGPDGNLWFINLGSVQVGEDQIVRMTPAGVFTEFVVPTPSSGLGEITAGPHGDLWFVESDGNANKIGRMTTDGAFTEYAIPTPYSIQTNQAQIAVGPDGNLWFTETMGNKIGRVTPAGTFTEFSLSSSPRSPIGIIAGPDGNLWFTASETGMAGGSFGPGHIGRMTPKGGITMFPLPGTNGNPFDIVAGHDGKLWFTQPGASEIGCITSGK